MAWFKTDEIGWVQVIDFNNEKQAINLGFEFWKLEGKQVLYRKMFSDDYLYGLIYNKRDKVKYFFECLPYYIEKIRGRFV